MYGHRGVSVDRTADLRALWKHDPAKRQRAGGGADPAAPAGNTAAPTDATAHALDELRKVVAKVGGEVADFCAAAVRRGDGDGADVVAQLIKCTDAQIQGLRATIFEGVRRKRGLLAALSDRVGGAAGAGSRAGSRDRPEDLPQQPRRHVLICDHLADELATFSGDLFFVVRYTDGLKEMRKKAGAFPTLEGVAAPGAGARAAPETVARTDAQSDLDNDADADADADAAEKLALLKNIAKGEVDAGGATSSSAKPTTTASDDGLRRRRPAAGNMDVGADDGDDGANGGPRPAMSNEVLLAALKDDAYQIKELGAALEQVANIADMIQTSLARQAEQVEQIESNAAETKGRIEDAEKNLRDATKIKWTPKRMTGAAIFAMANVLLLLHLIRPPRTMGCTDSREAPPRRNVQPQQYHPSAHGGQPGTYYPPPSAPPMGTPAATPRHGGNPYPPPPPPQQQVHGGYGPPPSSVYASQQPQQYAPPQGAYQPQPPQPQPQQPPADEEQRQLAEAIRQSQASISVESQPGAASTHSHDVPSPYASAPPSPPPQPATAAPQQNAQAQQSQATLDQLVEMYPRLDRSAIDAVMEAKGHNQEDLHKSLAELCSALPPPSMSARTWQEDDTVDAMFQGKWHPAVVLRQEPSGDFAVRWIEDDTQTLVTFDQIRPIRPA